MLVSASVKPDQRVHVDTSAPLELDHLHVAQAYFPRHHPHAQASQVSERSQRIDRRPSPQLRDTGIEEHCGLVVVAAEHRAPRRGMVVVSVTLPTAQHHPMTASRARTVTRAVSVPSVHGPEARRCESEEHGWVRRYLFWNTLSTPQSRRHECEGISSVDRRARRTEGLAPGPARLQQNAVGL